MPVSRRDEYSFQPGDTIVDKHTGDKGTVKELRKIGYSGATVLVVVYFAGRKITKDYPVVWGRAGNILRTSVSPIAEATRNSIDKLKKSYGFDSGSDPSDPRRKPVSAQEAIQKSTVSTNAVNQEIKDGIKTTVQDSVYNIQIPIVNSKPASPIVPGLKGVGLHAQITINGPVGASSGATVPTLNSLVEDLQTRRGFPASVILEYNRKQQLLPIRSLSRPLTTRVTLPSSFVRPSLKPPIQSPVFTLSNPVGHSEVEQNFYTQIIKPSDPFGRPIQEDIQEAIQQAQKSGFNILHALRESTSEIEYPLVTHPLVLSLEYIKDTKKLLRNNYRVQLLDQIRRTSPDISTKDALKVLRGQSSGPIFIQRLISNLPDINGPVVKGSRGNKVHKVYLQLSDQIDELLSSSIKRNSDPMVDLHNFLLSTAFSEEPSSIFKKALGKAAKDKQYELLVGTDSSSVSVLSLIRDSYNKTVKEHSGFVQSTLNTSASEVILKSKRLPTQPFFKVDIQKLINGSARAPQIVPVVDIRQELLNHPDLKDSLSGESLDTYVKHIETYLKDPTSPMLKYMGGSTSSFKVVPSIEAVKAQAIKQFQGQFPSSGPHSWTVYGPRNAQINETTARIDRLRSSDVFRRVLELESRKSSLERNDSFLVNFDLKKAQTKLTELIKKNKKVKSTFTSEDIHIAQTNINQYLEYFTLKTDLETLLSERRLIEARIIEYSSQGTTLENILNKRLSERAQLIESSRPSLHIPTIPSYPIVQDNLLLPFNIKGEAIPLTTIVNDKGTIVSVLRNNSPIPFIHSRTSTNNTKLVLDGKAIPFSEDPLTKVHRAVLEVRDRLSSAQTTQQQALSLTENFPDLTDLHRQIEDIFHSAAESEDVHGYTAASLQDAYYHLENKASQYNPDERARLIKEKILAKNNPVKYDGKAFETYKELDKQLSNQQFAELAQRHLKSVNALGITPGLLGAPVIDNTTGQPIDIGGSSKIELQLNRHYGKALDVYRKSASGIPLSSEETAIITGVRDRVGNIVEPGLKDTLEAYRVLLMYQAQKSKESLIEKASKEVGYRIGARAYDQSREVIVQAKVPENFMSGNRGLTDGEKEAVRIQDLNIRNVNGASSQEIAEQTGTRIANQLGLDDTAYSFNRSSTSKGEAINATHPLIEKLMGASTEREYEQILKSSGYGDDFVKDLMLSSPELAKNVHSYVPTAGSPLSLLTRTSGDVKLPTTLTEIDRALSDKSLLRVLTPTQIQSIQLRRQRLTQELMMKATYPERHVANTLLTFRTPTGSQILLASNMPNLQGLAMNSSISVRPINLAEGTVSFASPISRRSVNFSTGDVASKTSSEILGPITLPEKQSLQYTGLVSISDSQINPIQRLTRGRKLRPSGNTQELLKEYLAHEEVMGKSLSSINLEAILQGFGIPKEDIQLEVQLEYLNAVKALKLKEAKVGLKALQEELLQTAIMQSALSSVSSTGRSDVNMGRLISNLKSIQSKGINTQVLDALKRAEESTSVSEKSTTPSSGLSQSALNGAAKDDGSSQASYVENLLEARQVQNQVSESNSYIDLSSSEIDHLYENIVSDFGDTNKANSLRKYRHAILKNRDLTSAVPKNVALDVKRLNTSIDVQVESLYKSYPDAVKDRLRGRLYSIYIARQKLKQASESLAIAESKIDSETSTDTMREAMDKALSLQKKQQEVVRRQNIAEGLSYDLQYPHLSKRGVDFINGPKGFTGAEVRSEVDRILSTSVGKVTTLPSDKSLVGLQGLVNQVIGMSEEDKIKSGYTVKNGVTQVPLQFTPHTSTSPLDLVLHVSGHKDSTNFNLTDKSGVGFRIGEFSDDLGLSVRPGDVQAMSAVRPDTFGFLAKINNQSTLPVYSFTDTEGNARFGVSNNSDNISETVKRYQGLLDKKGKLKPHAVFFDIETMSSQFLPGSTGPETSVLGNFSIQGKDKKIDLVSQEYLDFLQNGSIPSPEWRQTKQQEALLKRQEKIATLQEELDILLRNKSTQDSLRAEKIQDPLKAEAGASDIYKRRKKAVAKSTELDTELYNLLEYDPVEYPIGQEPDPESYQKLISDHKQKIKDNQAHIEDLTQQLKVGRIKRDPEVLEELKEIALKQRQLQQQTILYNKELALSSGVEDMASTSEIISLSERLETLTARKKHLGDLLSRVKTDKDSGVRQEIRELEDEIHSVYDSLQTAKLSVKVADKAVIEQDALTLLHEKKTKYVGLLKDYFNAPESQSLLDDIKGNYTTKDAQTYLGKVKGQVLEDLNRDLQTEIHGLLDSHGLIPSGVELNDKVVKDLYSVHFPVEASKLLEDEMQLKGAINQNFQALLYPHIAEVVPQKDIVKRSAQFLAGLPSDDITDVVGHNIGNFDIPIALDIFGKGTDEFSPGAVKALQGLHQIDTMELRPFLLSLSDESNKAFLTHTGVQGFSSSQETLISSIFPGYDEFHMGTFDSSDLFTLLQHQHSKNLGIAPEEVLPVKSAINNVFFDHVSGRGYRITAGASINSEQAQSITGLSLGGKQLSGLLVKELDYKTEIDGGVSLLSTANFRGQGYIADVIRQSLATSPDEVATKMAAKVKQLAIDKGLRIIRGKDLGTIPDPEIVDSEIAPGYGEFLDNYNNQIFRTSEEASEFTSQQIKHFESSGDTLTAGFLNLHKDKFAATPKDWGEMFARQKQIYDVIRESREEALVTKTPIEEILRIKSSAMSTEINPNTSHIGNYINDFLLTNNGGIAGTRNIAQYEALTPFFQKMEELGPSIQQIVNMSSSGNRDNTITQYLGDVFGASNVPILGADHFAILGKPKPESIVPDITTPFTGFTSVEESLAFRGYQPPIPVRPSVEAVQGSLEHTRNMGRIDSAQVNIREEQERVTRQLLESAELEPGKHFKRFQVMSNISDIFEKSTSSIIGKGLLIAGAAAFAGEMISRAMSSPVPKSDNDSDEGADVLDTPRKVINYTPQELVEKRREYYTQAKRHTSRREARSLQTRINNQFAREEVRSENDDKRIGVNSRTIDTPRNFSL